MSFLNLEALFCTSSAYACQSNAGLHYVMNLHNRPSSSHSPHDPFHPHLPAPSSQPQLSGRLPSNAYSFRVQHPSQLDYAHNHAHPQPTYPAVQSHAHGPYGVPITPAYGHGYDRNSSLVNYLTPLSGPPQPPHLSHSAHSAHTHLLNTPMHASGSNPLDSPTGGSGAASVGVGGGSNALLGSMQWDPPLLARYAEFQLQQNHQRQQRALLEQQRQQLADLGIPVEDSSLLDQIFGNASTSNQNGELASTSHTTGTIGGTGDHAGQSGSMGMDQSGDNTSDNGGAFEWPSVSNASKRETNEGLYNQITSLVNTSRGSGGGGADSGGDGGVDTADGSRYEAKEDGNGGGGGGGGWGDDMPPFPSPTSTGEHRISA